MRNVALVISFIGTVGLVHSALADQGQFYVAPGAQWMDFDDETNLSEDTGWFVALGYDLTDRVSLEVSTFDLDPDSNGGKIDLDHYKFDISYDLSESRVRPFVIGGVGNTNFNGDNDTLMNYGVGLKVGLSDNLVWRTAVRKFNYLGRDREDGDVGVDSSLVFYFGGRGSRQTASRPSTPAPASSTPAPAPDSDRDGVPDSDDECPDTPMNYTVDAEGCPIPVEEVARVELLVNFEFDRSEVRPQFFDEIEEVADFMEQYPDVVVELEGHTDSIGSNEYNMGLSQRRADAVRDVLIERFDVQGSRISTRAFGEEQPVASNDTAAGRAQNRRVITVVIKTLQRYRPR